MKPKTWQKVLGILLIVAALIRITSKPEEVHERVRDAAPTHAP